MRILILSDTHEKTDDILALKKVLGKVDLIIHCGDGASDTDFISDYLKSRICAVSGNCDLFTREPAVMNLDIEGKKIHIEHGHRLPFNSDEKMFSFAKDNGYDVVLYGHTHIQKILYKDGIWIVNPGSFSRPKDGLPAYCILQTDGNGDFYFKGERL